jgi:hypothetical protein
MKPLPSMRDFNSDSDVVDNPCLIAEEEDAIIADGPPPASAIPKNGGRMDGEGDENEPYSEQGLQQGDTTDSDGSSTSNGASDW